MIEVDILSSLMVKMKLLPFMVSLEMAERFITLKVVKVLSPSMIIGSVAVFKATV